MRSLAPHARHTVLGLAAAAAVAAPLAVAPTTAEAAACTAKPVVVATHLEGSKLVLGTANTQKAELLAQIDQKGCSLSKVTMTVVSPDYSQTFTAAKFASADKNGRSIWGIDLSFHGKDLLNADAGSWHTSITAANADGSSSKAGPGFSVRRAAKLTTDAGPEPIRKGRTLTVKGVLQRADWQHAKYVGYSGQKVALQWRSSAKGSSYHTLKTITSRTGGALKTTVKAGKDGTYRFVYAGSTTTGSVNGGSDYVDVR